VRGARCEGRGTGHGVRGMWYEIRGTWYKVHGTGHSRAQMNNKDTILYIWHTAGWIGTPLLEEWLVGAENIPCSDFYKQQQQQKAE
jgi:hypothetical protein